MTDDRTARTEPGGNFSPTVIDHLERRSAAFAKALDRKGLPVTWGQGKAVRPGFEPKAGEAKGGKSSERG